MTQLKLPFSILPVKVLEKISSIFIGFSKRTANTKLKVRLKQAELSIKAEEYKALCITSSLLSFIVFTIIFFFIFKYLELNLLYSLLIGFFIAVFSYTQQINYPRLITTRKTREVEKNLVPALRALLVQLNAGLTFFDSINNIAKGRYGAVSKEFEKAVKDMQAGMSSVDALEKISFTNPSVFFRRILWQIMTGIQAGSDISIVLKEIVSSLATEQITEIQAYGARLSPLSMFYLLIAIILPSLGITFVIVLSSFMPVLGDNNKAVMYSLFGFVVFLQIMFLGMIKTRRPALS